jgi:hypothetical protein
MWRGLNDCPRVLGHSNVRLTQHTFLIIYFYFQTATCFGLFFKAIIRQLWHNFAKSVFYNGYIVVILNIIFVFKIKAELKLFPQVIKCTSWIICMRNTCKIKYVNWDSSGGSSKLCWIWGLCIGYCVEFFLDVMPCRLIEVCRRFGGTSWLRSKG